MRTRINYDLKRWISVCVVLVLLVSIFGPAVYATENDFEEITLALKSSEVDDDYIKLYLHDDVHYITLEDLCRLVRCTQSMNGDKISIAQGFWGAEFDVANQTFNDGYQIVDVRILEISDGIYAVPALMFLSYYKAVAFVKNNTLYCEMSEFTAWEALNINYENTLVDIYELYGGEGNVTLSLTLDILMDFIMGDMSTSDDYLSDAFLQAIKVDLYDYSSVQEYKKDSQDKLYKFLHSDQGVEFVEAVDDVLSVAAEPTQWYIQYYYNALEKSFVSLAYDAYEAGQHADVTHYGKKFYEAFTEKNKTSKAAEKYFDNADYVMLFVSAAADTAQQMKYTNATNNLVYNVMGQENLSYLGISPGEDNDWFTVANRFKNVLGVATTQMEAEAMQFFTDKLCWETLIGTGVSSAAGISGGAWTFSLNFARLFAEHFPLTSSSIDAFEADRRALYLSELQQNVYWVAMNTLQNMQNQWDNPEIYTKYIQALQLYCRTSIAMYENLITMVDEFGQDRDYWTNLFQARIDMLAVSLYQLTTYQDDNINKCLPLELETFSVEIKDQHTDLILNNGGLALQSGDTLLYWNIIDNGDTVSYSLNSETLDGEKVEIYRSSQRSNIYMVDGKIFMNEHGENGQDLWSVSIDCDGKNVTRHNSARVVGVDQTTGCAIMDYDSEKADEKKGIYIHNCATGKETQICGLSAEARFLEASDGIAYFYQRREDNVKVDLISYNINSEEIKVLSNPLDPYPSDEYRPYEIITFQLTDTAIFYSYDHYAGTAHLLQDRGAIIRINKEDGSSKVIRNCEPAEFYVFYKDGVEYIQTDGEVINTETGDSVATDMYGTLNVPFETLSDDITRVWIYPSDNGEVIQILPEMRLERGDTRYTYIRNINYLGDYVFYDLAYEKINPNPGSWRDYTIEYRCELYVYNLETEETRLLSFAEY